MFLRSDKGRKGLGGYVFQARVFLVHEIDAFVLIEFICCSVLAGSDGALNNISHPWRTTDVELNNDG